MTKIRVPDPVLIVDQFTNKPLLKMKARPEDPDEIDAPWTLLKFLERFAFPDPGIGKGRQAAKLISRVRKALGNALAGVVVELDTTDWEKIRDILNKPEAEWLPGAAGMAAQCERFYDSWFEPVET